VHKILCSVLSQPVDYSNSDHKSRTFYTKKYVRFWGNPKGKVFRAKAVEASVKIRFIPHWILPWSSAVFEIHEQNQLYLPQFLRYWSTALAVSIGGKAPDLRQVKISTVHNVMMVIVRGSDVTQPVFFRNKTGSNNWLFTPSRTLLIRILPANFHNFHTSIREKELFKIVNLFGNSTLKYRLPSSIPSFVARFHASGGCKRYLRSSGMLRSCLTLDDETDRLTRKVGRVQVKCDGIRWRTGGEVKGKQANGVCSQYPSHYVGTWRTQHYYRWCAHLGCQ